MQSHKPSRFKNGEEQGQENDPLPTAIPRAYKPYAGTGQHSAFQRLLHSHHPHQLQLPQPFNPSTLNPQFTYHSIPVYLTETEASIKDLTVVLSILNAKCAEPFRECLAELLSDGVNSENPIACLISDPLFNFTRVVAESFKSNFIVAKAPKAIHY